MGRLILLAIGIVLSAQGVRPETSSTPRPVDRKAARAFCRTIQDALRTQKYDGCKESFAKDVAGQGQTSLQETVAMAGDRRGWVFFTSPGDSKNPADPAVIEIRSTWIAIPMKGVREKREVHITEETFRFVDVNGKTLVDQYACRDVTEEWRNKMLTQVSKQESQLADRSLPEAKRLKAGIWAYIEMWQIGEFPHMWLLLDRLLDEGIAQEPKAMQGLQNLTRRVIEEVGVPEDHTPAVEKLLKWAPPPNKPEPEKKPEAEKKPESRAQRVTPAASGPSSMCSDTSAAACGRERNVSTWSSASGHLENIG
ncbi:MAG TPA: hypothetical protein VMY35_07250 [Phycisphaerae bacterium]|nr:hypothetical protein [Phycisphaerae bacterium]